MEILDIIRILDSICKLGLQGAVVFRVVEHRRQITLRQRIIELDDIRRTVIFILRNRYGQKFFIIHQGILAMSLRIFQVGLLILGQNRLGFEDFLKLRQSLGEYIRQGNAAFNLSLDPVKKIGKSRNRLPIIVKQG